MPIVALLYQQGAIFTHRIFDSRRHLILPNATVDEVHILELVSLSTRQYRPSFMPGNEHHQIIFVG
jgi:hypothetical protein